MIISLRDAKYYRASPDNTETIEIPATGWRGEYITTCVIYASLLTAGVKAFPCGNGDDVKLTASQHLSVLEYLKEQPMEDGATLACATQERPKTE